MEQHAVRKWAVIWMYGVVMGHLLVAALLPWVVNAAAFEAYHRGIEAVFWGGLAPAAARAQQTWWMALFSPTVQSLALWMGALTWIGHTQRYAPAWGWLLAGVLLWAPQDMYISLRAQCWTHVWIDCVAVLLMVPPLVWLFLHDRTVAVDRVDNAARGGMSTPAAGPSEGELFKKILGPEWLRLHPDIQRRFDKNPVPGQPLYYTGVLTELTCSRLGRLIGLLTGPLIKGALIPHNDADFPVDIQVYSKPDCPSIFKQRIYRLNGRKPIQFTSFMRESEKGEVLEYVGMGLGMKLVLDVRDGNLYFTSDGYFWQLFGWRMPLPALLTPGKTYLCHRNDSAEQFNIRIEIRHALFGTTFTQAGVFREIAADTAVAALQSTGEAR